MANRKLILYISMSLDGYLATKEDGLEWLSVVEQAGEDYGYAAFTGSVDTYLVGRKTYDVVLGLTGGKFPQAEQFDCYVITRKERPSENGVTFYNGDLAALINKLKRQEGGDIYCDGGGQIVQLLLGKNLIDEYIISVIPTILGDGKRLFIGGVDPIKLSLTSSKQFSSGLVQLRYRKG
ncbi:MAG: dihydrofolate reductase family protein [Bacteroidota bacterium]